LRRAYAEKVQRNLWKVMDARSDPGPREFTGD